MVIGITGGIGSGKTTVARMFEKLGDIALYIADFEAKNIMKTSSEIKKAMLMSFGQKIYNNDILDKKYLADIVFKNPKKLKVLNSIVHPVVLVHFKNFIKKNADKDYIIYENAILFENESQTMCDKIITVIASENQRIKRIIERDKTDREDALDRIKNQWTDEKKIIQSHYIIENNSIKKTLESVKSIHDKLIKKRYSNFC